MMKLFLNKKFQSVLWYTFINIHRKTSQIHFLDIDLWAKHIKGYYGRYKQNLHKILKYVDKL